MDKLCYRLTIRLNQHELDRLHGLMTAVSADSSSLMRLALKRMFRKPPVKRFRYRLRRGAKI